jgi:hypothetical protein
MNIQQQEWMKIVKKSKAILVDISTIFCKGEIVGKIFYHLTSMFIIFPHWT